MKLLPGLACGLVVAIGAGCASSEPCGQREWPTTKSERDLCDRDARIESLQAQLEQLRKQLAEKDLVLAAWYANGFDIYSSGPMLAGAVRHVEGSQVTLQIADNPADIQIADLIAGSRVCFALYSVSGIYKGDCVAQKYDSERGCVIAELVLAAGDAVIEAGDRAATCP